MTRPNVVGVGMEDLGLSGRRRRYVAERDVFALTTFQLQTWYATFESLNGMIVSLLDDHGRFHGEVAIVHCEVPPVFNGQPNPTRVLTPVGGVHVPTPLPATHIFTVIMTMMDARTT